MSSPPSLAPGSNPALVLSLSLILAGALLEALGDVLLKSWADSARSWLLVAGLGIYFAGAGFWAASLKYDLLARSASVFTVANLALVALLGVVLFDEKLSATQWLGVGLSVVAVALIEQ
jgi:multidrug transporter EmrE-like cation transporter